MNSIETLGEKIKKARKKRKLTQSDLAGNFITRTMLSKIENDVAKPSLETIKNIAQQLELPVSYFLDDYIINTSEEKDKFLIIFEHLSFLHKNDEYKKGVEYFEKIISSSIIEKDNESYNKCLLIATFCYYKNGNHTKTTQNLKVLKEYFLAKEDNYYLSQIFHLIGVRAFYNNEFEISASNVEIAIDYFNKSYIDDQLYMIRMYYTYGNAVFDLKNYQKAYNIFTKGIQLAKESNCLYKTGEMFMFLGLITKKLNRLSESINYTKKAILYFRIFENEELIARCQNNLAIAYNVNEEYEESIIYSNYALEYFQNENDYKKSTEIKACKFTSIIELKDYEKALILSNEIELDYLQGKDKIEYLIGLSKLENHLGNHEESKEYLFKSDQLLLGIDDFINLKSIIYNDLATLYSEEEDFKKAYEYSNKANNLKSNTIL